MMRKRARRKRSTIAGGRSGQPNSTPRSAVSARIAAESRRQQRALPAPRDDGGDALLELLGLTQIVVGGAVDVHELFVGRRQGGENRRIVRRRNSVVRAVFNLQDGRRVNLCRVISSLCV